MNCKIFKNKWLPIYVCYTFLIILYTGFLLIPGIIAKQKYIDESSKYVITTCERSNVVNNIK
jgi:hypothetical protein